MTHEQIIRAWKDEDYRLGLSPSELSALPQNPAGVVELLPEEVGSARGMEEELADSALILTCLLCTLCVGHTCYFFCGKSNPAVL